ncbi:hypothetical protein GLYMA_17G141900v4 [Glycine max]|uniref:No apical meristem-associated C-terminal domain-containing protein n=2 Tax=Glycine subgen. Soja TaxID=1462606 RepID=K7MLL0_SOYBN|nr:hypothetical protein glysoja_017122 [Glycine soja]KRH04131.1 hypothetical protein GLYMA_17G141900v4 [Glycine max]RZB56841.1 hypothetical protein D0Y65_045800 [Glycine soja]
MDSSDSDPEETLEWKLIEDLINDDHPYLPSFHPNTSPDANVEQKAGKRKRKSKVNEASSSTIVEKTAMLEIKLRERELRLKRHELMMKEMNLMKERELKIKEMEFELKLLCKDTSKLTERQLQDYEKICKSIREKYGIA